MLIIETSVFTHRVLKLLRDDDYRLLQYHLVADPEAGSLIRGSVGLRKVRWAAANAAVFVSSTIGLPIATSFLCF
jgi:hypothetical protein